MFACEMVLSLMSLAKYRRVKVSILWIPLDEHDNVRECRKKAGIEVVNSIFARAYDRITMFRPFDLPGSSLERLLYESLSAALTSFAHHL
jgi:hypothetical protein